MHRCVHLIWAGAAGSLLLRLPVAGAWILTTAWCFVPVVWGLWAMLAPSQWVPNRLPAWGAILGVVAGIMAGPVLNLPLRILGWSGVGWVPVIWDRLPITFYGCWAVSPIVPPRTVEA